MLKYVISLGTLKPLSTPNMNIDFKLAKDIYCAPSMGPLSPEQVETVILEVALSAYDNASNGNKTRGGVKKASEM